MKSGRHHTHHRRGDSLRGQVGMALQTDLACFGPRQHTRVGGAVRLVTSGAAIETDRTMFKRKGTAFVAVAPHAARLIGRERLAHRGARGTVRIVAIHARHGVFRHLMAKRFGKLSLHRNVARFALSVHRGRLACHQSGAARLVNFVTTGARDRIFRVDTLNASGLSGLIEMASEASLVGGPRYIGNAGRFRMFGTATVTGFAGVLFPVFTLAGFDDAVRTLQQSFGDVFVTGLANGRPGEFRPEGTWRGRCPTRRQQQGHQTGRKKSGAHINTGHGPSEW